MDKKGIIAVVLAIAVMFAWLEYTKRRYPTPPPPKPEPTEAKESAAPAVAAATETPVPELVAPTATPTPAPAGETFEEKVIAITSHDKDGEPVNTYQFTNRGGGILVAELLKHLGKNGENVLLNAWGDIPVGALADRPDVHGKEEWRIVEHTDSRIVFQRAVAAGVTATKTFTVPDSSDGKDPYTAEVAIQFSNEGTESYTSPGYFFRLGSSAPLHESDWATYTKFAWFTAGEYESIDVNWFNASRIPLLGIQTRPERSQLLEEHPKITWAGVKDQYFTTIALNRDAIGNRVWARTFKTDEETKAIEGAMGIGAFTVPPGQSVTQSFELYFGPKEYKRLKAIGSGVSEAMDFGVFKLVSIFLLKLLNGIHGIVRDYGVSILILTLLIKSALWPLQNKATNSMKRMQALQPKMTELREKYKDDPQKMNAELMKMYKDYGINPFGGCLPMFVQIPIFFGFYRMLGTAEELRNEHFLWVKDLSQPDTVAVIPGLHWPINILPLLMAATMLWQQRLTPKSGDQMQQRVFMFVPLIFVVFCYNFASALALYWTAQNLFSVVQLYLTRNKELPALTKVTKPEAGGGGGKKKRK